MGEIQEKTGGAHHLPALPGFEFLALHLRSQLTVMSFTDAADIRHGFGQQPG